MNGVLPPSVSVGMMGWDASTPALQHGAVTCAHGANAFTVSALCSFSSGYARCVLLGLRESVWCDPSCL